LKDLRLLEFEGKGLFKLYGIQIPKGSVIKEPQEAAKAFRDLEVKEAVLKSQVPVGGRGKAGGILKARNEEEAVEKSKELFKKEIKGFLPKHLLIEEALEVQQELYLSCILDREDKTLSVLISKFGGMDIEQVALENPLSIIKISQDPWEPFKAHPFYKVAKSIGLRGNLIQEFAKTVKGLINLTIDSKAMLTEINPLAVVKDKLIAMDSKILLDDDSLNNVKIPYREFLNRAENEIGIVELEGNIGIIGNGAGLTMATMDMVYYFGGRPANFLDVGGGASSEKVKQAVVTLLNNNKVKSLFINIFGGITRCDEVANGIVSALRESRIRKPIFVRLVGTNQEEGKKILESENINVFDTAEEAAREAVKAAGE
jgi:succinyl-CoA synthetase beta subunit